MTGELSARKKADEYTLPSDFQLPMVSVLMACLVEVGGCARLRHKEGGQ